MAGQDYKIDFSAANPTLYSKLFPKQVTVFPSLRASNTLPGASDDTSVEFLASKNLALGQIVPFEFRISANSEGKINGDTITFTAGWQTVTTNSSAFGYDKNFGIVAAFVDSSDPNTRGDTNAIVSDFTWKLVGTEIQGTFKIANLDPGEEVVVEAWLVLQDKISKNAGGNVQARLIGAQTSGQIEAGEKINTGTQTIPLLKVNDLSPNHIFDNGTFIVDATGQVQFDYLYDGGWFQGELAVFSVKGMEAYIPGSVEFIKEAAKRALSNSTQGRILAQDATEGAKFQAQLGWENNFNSGEYKGIKTFAFNPGDEVAFMMTQNVSIEALYQNPSQMSQWGKLPIFSIAQANPYGKAANQLVAVDNNGTLAFDDTRIDQGKSDQDYNDMVFQVRGLQGNNIASMNNLVNTERDWRTHKVGKQLLSHSNIASFDTGVFEVGETGQVKVDFLFDGGWFQSELAVFSLEGMNVYTPGSTEFIMEAARRALSNSTQGYVVIKDATEGAKFTNKPAWENNFNSGAYQGVKTFNMNAGDKFAFMLIQNTTVQETLNNPGNMGQWGKLPVFSIPELNINGQPQGQIVDADGNGTFVFEDTRVDLTNSDRDYNDFVFQVKGAKGKAESIDKYIKSNQDWRKTQVGNNLKNYANRSLYNEGVFQVDNSGQVKIDFLFDGGWYEGQVGMFSLQGMDIYQTGSKAFVQEALNRTMSNSSLGHVIINDKSDQARYSSSLRWEKDFNSTGIYQGTRSFQMNAGDTFGLVLIPDGTFSEASTAPSWATKKQPIFSMSDANHQKQERFGDVLTGAKGKIVSFEDIPLSVSNNIDYNDIVLAIGGAQAIGGTDIDELIDSNRDWLNTQVGNEILNYFNQVQF
ncbi:MAG: hypothetical protein Kow0049_24170 [Stanieria sp.]